MRPSPEIAAEIKRIREAGFPNQTEFARAVGTSQSRLSIWERAGDGYSFDPDTLRRIAEVGGVPVEVFYVDDGKEPAPLTVPEVARLRERMRRVVRDAGEVLRELNGALGLSAEQMDEEDAEYLFGPGGEPQEDDSPDAPKAAKPKANPRRRPQQRGKRGNGPSPD